MEGSTSSNRSGPDSDRKYDSCEGRHLFKKILTKYVVYDPHDYILDGICPVMDGFDLLPSTPTGSGKTGYLILLMLVVREIAADKTLAITKENFPKDHCWCVLHPSL